MPRRFRMRESGKHTMPDGRVVTKGDTVVCEAEDLGGAIVRFEALDPPPPTEAEGPPKKYLRLQHLGFGKWHVLNEATNKPINDHPLTKIEAEALVRFEEMPPEQEGGPADAAVE